MPGKPCGFPGTRHQPSGGDCLSDARFTEPPTCESVESSQRKVNEALQNGCDVVKSYPSEGIEKQQEKRAACAGNWNCANVFSAHPSTG